MLVEQFSVLTFSSMHWMSNISSAKGYYTLHHFFDSSLRCQDFENLSLTILVVIQSKVVTNWT